MKIVKYITYALLFLSSCLIAPGCVDTSEYIPLDIIKGKQDVAEIYYKQNLVNPISIEGVVTDIKTQLPIFGVSLMAKLEGTDVVYKTKTKEDGTYKLYIESDKNYVLYAYKDGYEKSYYFEGSWSQVDTIINIYYDSSIDFEMVMNDSIPIKSVDYLSTRYLTTSITDLSLTDAGTVGFYYSNLYQFDIDGAVAKTTTLKYYSDMLAIQDTCYWFGGNSNKTMYKYGQKGGKLIQTVYCQVPSGYYYDFEIINNTFWLISRTMLYNLALNGDLIKAYDLTDKIYDLSLVGLTKSGNFLYLLNKATKTTNVHKGYCIYKFDTSLSKFVSKGYFPNNVNSLTLKGLSTYNNAFWSISDNSSYDDLVKFRINE